MLLFSQEPRAGQYTFTGKKQLCEPRAAFMVNVTVGECPITPVSCETFEQNRRGGTQPGANPISGQT